MLENFFYNRANNEQNISKWSNILDEGFRLTLPITPYRAFPFSEVKNGQRHIEGIQPLLEDTASMGAMIQGIGKRNRTGECLRLLLFLMLSTT